MSPLYEYKCLSHGLFQVLRTIGSPKTDSCPQCSAQCVRMVSAPAPAVIKETEQLPYGKGSRGRYISSEETGGLAILVPSWGALEKEEVDYVAEVAIEKEKERVRIGSPREAKVAIENIVRETVKAPKGKRKQTMDKVMKEGMR